MSGQIPVTKFGKSVSISIAEGTEVVLANLAAVLQASGSSLNKVLKVTLFLTSVDEHTLHRVDSVYERIFSGQSRPAAA